MLLLQAILGVVDIFAESFIIFLTKCLDIWVQVLVYQRKEIHHTTKLKGSLRSRTTIRTVVN